VLSPTTRLVRCLTARDGHESQIKSRKTLQRVGSCPQGVVGRGRMRSREVLPSPLTDGSRSSSSMRRVATSSQRHAPMTGEGAGRFDASRY
jgi:hypothetical protein